MNRTLSAAAVLAVFCCTLRADFGYEIRAEVTGGSLLKPEERLFITHLIKGQRLAILIKGHTTVINLENDTVTEIDYVKKTYQNLTLAQFKEKLPHTDSKVEFQSVPKPGGIKTIGILTAHEQTVRMTSTSPTLAHIFLDYWTMTPPGFEEVQDFRQKLAAKLGESFAIGVSDIVAPKPELLPGLDQAAKTLLDADELPVESIIRIGGPQSGDLAPAGGTEAKPGILGETLNQLGNISRRVTRQPSQKQQDEPPGLLTEITIDLTDFAAGKVDDAKINVPGNFKEIKPPEAKKP
jgi:hypothetical protein